VAAVLLAGGLHGQLGNARAANITLQGTGATFPAPLYQRWFKEYNKMHPEVQVNYQALGSGAGVKQFQDGLVNFGASDAAMTDEEIAAVKDGVVLLPMTAGSIVLAYNLPGGPTELKLSRDAYVGIFLGKITTWNDPKIASANPGVRLPALKITPVRRSDGSGTTFVFTQHLSAISDAWKSGPGTGKSVNFPAGVGSKGNPGVTATIKQTPGRSGTSSTGTPSKRGRPWRPSRTRAART
jgi:phosphate transport system substrate-binding protein